MNFFFMIEQFADIKPLDSGFSNISLCCLVSFELYTFDTWHAAI